MEMQTYELYSLLPRHKSSCTGDNTLEGIAANLEMKQRRAPGILFEPLYARTFANVSRS